jgi:hypothetical protein
VLEWGLSHQLCWLAIDKVVHTRSFPLVLLTPTPINLLRCHHIRVVDVRSGWRLAVFYERESGRLRIPPHPATSARSQWDCWHHRQSALVEPSGCECGPASMALTDDVATPLWAACVPKSQLLSVQSRRLTTHWLRHIYEWVGTMWDASHSWVCGNAQVGVDPNEQEAPFGGPLHIAASFGHVSVCKVLIAHGVGARLVLVAVLFWCGCLSLCRVAVYFVCEALFHGTHGRTCIAPGRCRSASFGCDSFLVMV